MVFSSLQLGSFMTTQTQKCQHFADSSPFFINKMENPRKNMIQNKMNYFTQKCIYTSNQCTEIFLPQPQQFSFKFQ